MLRPRIIPSLLIHEKGLVKTKNFKKPRYVGDPINAVRIFNEKEVDELAIFDIDATLYKNEPDYDLIEKIASQSRMPICYGGGVKNVDQAQKISSLGIEKIAISSAAIDDPNLIAEMAKCIGKQSVVVVLDVKKRLLGGYDVFTHNGKKKRDVSVAKFIKEVDELGAGEIIINSIDRDGEMKGYDLNLIDKIRSITSLPLTILGGAGNLSHLKSVTEKYPIIGLAAGSMFVFKGKYKAVLINYPSREEKKIVYQR